MKYKILMLVAAAAFVLTSCYHAQITTGANPSAKVIDNPWAHSFIFGLVPPKEVNVASECPNGVAKVETQINFLNGLVSVITFNIYTPMQITVTCAAGSDMSEVKDAANGDEDVTIIDSMPGDDVVQRIQEASEAAVSSRKPVYVAFH